jgi:N4-gp56 family major capsid protein
MPDTSYGDISPRTAAFAAKEFLVRALPYLVFEKFGQTRPHPGNNSKTQKFRRYEALSFTPNPLTEGVTPAGKQMTFTDVNATLVQYGDLMRISDVIMDTHEDPVLKECQGLLGEQAANMLETVRYNILKAGTSIRYANGASRGAVNTPLTLVTLRRAVRDLQRQNAKKITQVLSASPNYGTDPVAPAYVAVHHPDLENDIRGIAGFVPTEKYGSVSPWENETGKVEQVRFVSSTLITPFVNAGGAKGLMMSTGGTDADVYPILLLARDAYGIVPLRGKTAVTPMVVNPTPSDSDPMAQRATVSWKTMQTAVILNDLFMVRLEVAATA